MPQSEWMLAPQHTTYDVAVEPAHNALESLLMISSVERFSGLSEWVLATSARLSPEHRHRNRVVMEGLFHALVPGRRFASFPAYVDDLAQRPPEELRDQLLSALVLPPHLAANRNQERLADPQALLADVGAYLSFVAAHFGVSAADFGVEAEAHALMNDPAAMQATIVGHLRFMWEDGLAAEYQRVLPLLDESVRAFRAIDLTRLQPMEATRTVLGYEPPAKLQQLLEQARQVVFVPSAHVGPYLGKFASGTTLWLIFGARLPDGAAVRSSALDRSELLVRLSALTDDSRLRMLQLLSRDGEICAQDMMSALELSQSAASRHLRQLSAAGYVAERWRDGAKCYTLNRRRIDETLQAFTRFLEQPED